MVGTQRRPCRCALRAFTVGALPHEREVLHVVYPAAFGSFARRRLTRPSIVPEPDCKQGDRPPTAMLEECARPNPNARGRRSSSYGTAPSLASLAAENIGEFVLMQNARQASTR